MARVFRNPQDATSSAPACSVVHEVYEISETLDVWVLSFDKNSHIILSPNEYLMLLFFVSIGAILFSVLFLCALTHR